MKKTKNPLPNIKLLNINVGGTDYVFFRRLYFVTVTGVEAWSGFSYSKTVLAFDCDLPMNQEELYYSQNASVFDAVAQFYRTGILDYRETVKSV